MTPECATSTLLTQPGPCRTRSHVRVRHTAQARLAHNARSVGPACARGWKAAPASFVRFYDPSTGRLLTPDPRMPNAKGTEGFSSYGYAGANPASLVDPSGRDVLLEYSSRLLGITQQAQFAQKASRTFGEGLACMASQLAPSVVPGLGDLFWTGLNVANTGVLALTTEIAGEAGGPEALAAGLPLIVVGATIAALGVYLVYESCQNPQ